jgi:hypothetical protein
LLFHLQRVMEFFVLRSRIPLCPSPSRHLCLCARDYGESTGHCVYKSRLDGPCHSASIRTPSNISVTPTWNGKIGDSFSCTELERRSVSDNGPSFPAHEEAQNNNHTQWKELRRERNHMQKYNYSSIVVNLTEHFYLDSPHEI